MPKVTAPAKCAKCGSSKIRHEELSMHGYHGHLGASIFRFDVYICEECAYSEFYFNG